MEEGRYWLRVFKDLSGQYHFLEEQKRSVHSMLDFKYEMSDMIKRRYNKYKKEHPDNKYIREIDEIIRDIMGIPPNNGIYRNFTRNRVGSRKPNKSGIYNNFGGGRRRGRRSTKRSRT